MNKNLIVKLGLALSLCLATEALPAQNAQMASKSFLGSMIQGYQTTNAAAASSFTNTLGGFMVTNAASAPLGGYTNIGSWTYGGIVQTTNMQLVTWTNAFGVWVIPTNNTPGSLVGVSFVTNDTTPLTIDLPVPVGTTGHLMVNTTTNNWQGDATAYAVSPMTISARLWGQSGAAGGTLNLIFVGVPDGTNEPSSATVGAIPAFQWGIATAAGTTVTSTNFPIWKFAGCKSVRLRSATITTTSAASIGVVVQALNFNGPFN